MDLDHFKEQKNNIFYSYAVLCISSRLKTYVNSYLNSKNKFLNDSVSLDDDSDNNLDSVSSIRFCDNFIYFYERLINFKNNLDNKKSQVFELKYNGFSNRDISILLDLSVKYVYYCVCSIKNKLIISGFEL